MYCWWHLQTVWILKFYILSKKRKGCHDLTIALWSKCQYCSWPTRAPDKVHIFISKTSISWPNPMFDHLLESSHRDDSNKWSNIGFCQEIKALMSIEIHFTHLIWRSAYLAEVWLLRFKLLQPHKRLVLCLSKQEDGLLQVPQATDHLKYNVSWLTLHVWETGQEQL